VPKAICETNVEVNAKFRAGGSRREGMIGGEERGKVADVSHTIRTTQ
jgi:hypothetical protein